MLWDDDIARILGEHRDPGAAAHALIDAANQAGGHDNISVVIVDIEGEARGRAAGESEATGRGWLGAAVWLIVAAVVIAGSLGVGYRYAYSRAYAIAEDGVVVLYRGVPGQFAGLRLSKRLERTDIPVADLPPAVQSRLAAGIELDGASAALKLAEEYRAMLPDAR
jgi:protein phosphatase